MTISFQTIKSGVLGIAVLVGLAVHGSPAHSAESKTAVFAGGCFWCVESDFESVAGVIEVVSGFTGGHVKNPTYKQVTRGGSGHVEAAMITYDPGVVSYAQLLDMFFRSVDPTDAGGQFCDRGASYTTAIFVSDPAEKAAAEAAKSKAEAALGQSVVTPIQEAGEFYRAPNYHQDFYKSSEIIITRFGPRKKSEAYKRYRKACGRDQRVKELWGDQAPFASGHS